MTTDDRLQMTQKGVMRHTMMTLIIPVSDTPFCVSVVAQKVTLSPLFSLKGWCFVHCRGLSWKVS